MGAPRGGRDKGSSCDRPREDRIGFWPPSLRRVSISPCHAAFRDGILNSTTVSTVAHSWYTHLGIQGVSFQVRKMQPALLRLIVMSLCDVKVRATCMPTCSTRVNCKSHKAPFGQAVLAVTLVCWIIRTAVAWPNCALLARGAVKPASRLVPTQRHLSTRVARRGTHSRCVVSGGFSLSNHRIVLAMMSAGVAMVAGAASSLNRFLADAKKAVLSATDAHEGEPIYHIVVGE